MSRIGVAALAAMLGLTAWTGVRAEGKVVGRLRPELGDLRIVGTLRLADPMSIIPLDDKVECGGREYLVRYAKGADLSQLKTLDGKKVVINGHLRNGPAELLNPEHSKKVTVFYCTNLRAADKDDKEVVTVTLRGELSYIDLGFLRTRPVCYLTLGGEMYHLPLAGKELTRAAKLDGLIVLVTATLDKGGNVIVTGLRPSMCW